MARFCRSAFICAIVFVRAVTAFADHVSLKNGDALTGHISSTSPTALIIDTDLAGQVTIPWTAVASVVPAGAVPAGVRLDGSSAATTAGAAHWHGALNAGLDVSHGNSETRGITSNATLSRIGPHDRLGMFGAHLSSSVGSGTDAVTTARATRGGVRYDHDLKAPLYGFGFFDAENDLLQLLDLRTVAGGGVGAHLLNTGTTQLNAFAGVSFAHDAYSDLATPTSTTTTTTTTTTTGNGGAPATTPGKGGTPPGQGGTPPGQSKVNITRGGTPPAVVRTTLSRDVGEFLVGQDLTHQLSGSMGLSESFTLFPAVSAFSDYRVSFDLSLWAQLSGWLQWNASIADRYLHIPPAGGAVQNDTFVWTGLGITFGRSAGSAYTGADGRRTRSR